METVPTSTEDQTAAQLAADRRANDEMAAARKREAVERAELELRLADDLQQQAADRKHEQDEQERLFLSGAEMPQDHDPA